MDNDDFKTIDHMPEEPARRSFWNRWTIAGVAAVIAIGTVTVAGAMGGEKGGWGMHRAAMGFAEHRFERVLDEIGASDEQQEKIWGIVDKARTDVRPIMRDFRDSRSEIADILGAASIDRNAAEALRAERLVAMDNASRTLSTALLDAAEVLTPEQRAELAKHFKERGGRGRW